MLNRKESFCLFLVSVLLFSSFYSSSSFFGMGRVTNIPIEILMCICAIRVSKGAN